MLFAKKNIGEGAGKLRVAAQVNSYSDPSRVM